MAISDLLNRRVRARPEEEGEDVYSEESGSEAGSNESGSGESDDEVDENEDSMGEDGPEDEDAEDEEQDEDEDEDPDNDDIPNSINTISFGALAKAQASMGPKSKSKKRNPEPSEQPTTQETESPLDTIRSQIRSARLEKRKSRDKESQSRTSKHAPAIQSSRHAVTRKRPVVTLPATQKPRDPRFDPTIQATNKSKTTAESAYAFLDEYRNSELRDLKTQLAQTKDPAQRDALKKSIRSAGDRIRSIENKKRERDVLGEHKRKEKQLIKEGKKSAPYFLKRSDLREQAAVKKYQGMGSRERVRALERRRKKVASKERKEMPMERRGIEDVGEGQRKRKRV